jgi:hypothetical protein
MPRDRFAGVRSIERYGQVTLKPISMDGVEGITMNADAREGAVRTEVLSEDGYRVRGFSKGDALPIHGDDLRHSVSWEGRSLSDLAAGRYMLRLHLDRAQVYALTLSRQ